MNALEKLRARLKELAAEYGALDLTTAEALDKAETLKEAIATQKRLIEAEETRQRELAALTGSDPAPAPGAKVPAAAKDPEAMKFRSFGEQLQSIANASINKLNEGERDPRLVYRAPSGANVGVPSEGGFLVQQDYSTEMLAMSHEMANFAGRVTNLPISEDSNGIKLPVVDETSRADGSRWGGIQVYMAAEAETVTAKKPKFGQIELSLNKMMGIGYVTDEILKDARALEAIMKRGFAEEIAYKTDDLILNGTGSGQPLGIFNGGALITVTAESGQAADTINATNVLNMMARMTMRSWMNAVWVTTQEALPQLWTMVHPGTQILLYQPPGLNGNVDANAPYGYLLGRPLMMAEQIGRLGDAADLSLIDFSHYLMIDKGGVNTADSMHVRFLYDEMVFRITYRLDGQPGVRTAMTPANGGPTQSPFVTLGART